MKTDCLGVVGVVVVVYKKEESVVLTQKISRIQLDISWNTTKDEGTTSKSNKLKVNKTLDSEAFKTNGKTEKQA